MEVSIIILSILSTFIMSIPFSILIANKINDKYSISYFFITLITILYFNNDMKNIVLFIIYVTYSFIFIFLITKNIKFSFLWILIINVLQALGDHISGFIFINIFKLSKEIILTSSIITILFNIFIIAFTFIFSIILKTLIKISHKHKFQKG